MRATFCVLLLCSLAAAGARANEIVVANSGFETPDLGSGSSAYGYVGAPAGPLPIDPGTPGIGWTFSPVSPPYPTAGSGIAANGSNFDVRTAPNGNADGATSTAGQAGVIQGGDGTLDSSVASYIEQTLSGFEAGTATIDFLAAGRLHYGEGLGPNTIDVYLDDTLLGSVTPELDVFGPVSFTTDVTAGSHTLRFVGDNPVSGDRTSFIDSVNVTNIPVPEPSTFLLFATGLLLLGRCSPAAGKRRG